MKNYLLCLSLFCMGGLVSGAESYTDLMFRAEKLVKKCYPAESRAYKIKSGQLDAIMNSRETETVKIRKLHDLIAEMEKSHPQESPKPAAKKVESSPVSLQTLAKSGDVKAMLKLADFYKYDHPRERIRYLRMASDAGSGEGAYLLGRAYWEGAGVRRSYANAFRYLTLADKRDHKEARGWLALAYLEGKGIIANPEKAFKMYKSMYDGGMTGAGVPLGVLCYYGKGTAKDYRRAVEYLTRGVVCSDIPPGKYPAYAILGKICYDGGFGTEKDLVSAVHFLQLAGNHEESWYLLGNLYRDGAGGLSKDPVKACEYYQKAADKGVIAASAEMGKCCCYGRGTEVNYYRAVRYLKLPAVRGDVEAGYLLGVIYMDRKIPETDDFAAFQYLKRLAQQGDPDASLRCGKLSSIGRGCDRDLNEALKFYATAVKYGVIEAMYLSGKTELELKHPDKAAVFFRMAADKGHTESIAIFADMAINGQGMKADPILGILYLQVLAKSGDLASIEKIGKLYEQGWKGTKPDLDKAAVYYQQGAAKKSLISKVRLAFIYYQQGKYQQALAIAQEIAAQHDECSILAGRMYLEGKVGPKDPQKALQFLKAAAEKEDPYACRLAGKILFDSQRYTEAERFLKIIADPDHEVQYMLGKIYYSGVNSSPDYKKALEYLEKSAKSGNVDAMLLLGEMYQQGKGVTQDFTRALAWYKRAGEQGSAAGMFQTGCMYYNGDGVSPDFQMALQWFKKAAGEGHTVAMQYISIMYKNGIGVEKNAKEAQKWQSKAK